MSDEYATLDVPGSRIGRNAQKVILNFLPGTSNLSKPSEPDSRTTRPKVKTGAMVTFRSDPSAAVVLIDGRKMKIQTPMVFEKMPLGKHSLKVYKPNHVERVQKIDVPPEGLELKLMLVSSVIGIRKEQVNPSRRNVVQTVERREKTQRPTKRKTHARNPHPFNAPRLASCRKD